MAIIIPRRAPSTKFDLIQEFRSLKLKAFNEEISFNPSVDFIKLNKKKLEFISNNFPDDIITGSLSLQILGLLVRETNDIDILIKDKNRYSNYKNSSYSESEIKNRLGFIDFSYKKSFLSRTNKYQVDFFEDTGSNYIEFDFNDKKMKLQHPLEVIDQKIKIWSREKFVASNNRKHLKDLHFIFSHFEEN
jgi:hypothetical protein